LIDDNSPSYFTRNDKYPPFSTPPELQEETYRGFIEELTIVNNGPLTISQIKAIELYLHVLGIRKANTKDLQDWTDLLMVSPGYDKFADSSFYNATDDGHVLITVCVLALVRDREIRPIFPDNPEDSVRYVTIRKAKDEITSH
jgi:hypothetical protein